jgi:hypothetical protein
MKQVNIQGYLECTISVKYFIFRCHLEFLVGVKMDRWHHSKSEAVDRINECALVKAFERFWRAEGRSFIGFIWEKYFIP